MMDEMEFERRARACTQKLFRVCYAILPERADRDDAIQEALIKAWQKRGTLRNDSVFESWLIRIAITKNYGNSRTTVSAVVSDKHMDLFVQTMFASAKKESLATATDEQASVNTPKATGGTAPDSSISDFEPDVNDQTKYSINTDEIFYQH